MSLELNHFLQDKKVGNNSVINELASFYYNKEETISSVQVNFDFRRFYSAEGKKITVKDSFNNYVCTDNCLVQTPSNPLREFFDYRKIHCPNSMKIQRGYYVEYEDSTWLIDSNIVDVDGAYQSARMNRCNYKIKWQDESGKIIEKYCYSQDSSSYSNGITGTTTITLGSDQMMVRLPFDDDTKKIPRDKKFFIDYYNDDPVCYELTRHDRSSFMDKDNVGICSWILSECAHTNTDLDLQYGIPDFDEKLYNDFLNDNVKKNTTINNIVKYYIKYNGNPVVKSGGNSKTFSFVSCDIDNNISEVNFSSYTWRYNIDQSIIGFFTINEFDNKSKIKIKYDESIIGMKFNISVYDGINLVDDLLVEIVG